MANAGSGTARGQGGRCGAIRSGRSSSVHREEPPNRPPGCAKRVPAGGLGKVPGGAKTITPTEMLPPGRECCKGAKWAGPGFFFSADRRSVVLNSYVDSGCFIGTPDWPGEGLVHPEMPYLLGRNRPNSCFRPRNLFHRFCDQRNAFRF